MPDLKKIMQQHPDDIEAALKAVLAEISQRYSRAFQDFKELPFTNLDDLSRAKIEEMVAAKERAAAAKEQAAAAKRER